MIEVLTIEIYRIETLAVYLPVILSVEILLMEIAFSTTIFIDISFTGIHFIKQPSGVISLPEK